MEVLSDGAGEVCTYSNSVVKLNNRPVLFMAMVLTTNTYQNEGIPVLTPGIEVYMIAVGHSRFICDEFSSCWCIGGRTGEVIVMSWRPQTGRYIDRVE